MTLIRTLIVLAIALLALPAAAQELPPRPDGPVYDGANMIDDAVEAQLDERLRAYNRETGRSVIVATVPSLDGETVEGYAVELYETWGIGGEDTDEGALLLVAQEERKIRIEVGYGSTPTLTDAASGRIIRNTITPAFKQDDYTGGIVAGVAQMIEALDMDPATARAIEEAEAAARAEESEISGATVIGAAVWIGLILLFALVFGRGKKGRRRRRYGAGDAVGDVLLWSAIGSMLNDGDGGGWGGGGGGFGGGGGGGFGGFGGGMSGGGGASGGW
ncbi:TPM domain-containing protein [Citromicrobium sp. JLT1363]|uniref:TPM domain-containing protein n=1 Tax=Citromicrobium sp. JLT1363 TaxID=517722 RepID=UPI000225EB9D|nr:TPM domain-containing protein [Citromicrobium sp. JLT1363]